MVQLRNSIKENERLKDGLLRKDQLRKRFHQSHSTKLYGRSAQKLDRENN